MNGDGMGCGFHPSGIESIQLLHVGKNLLQLVPKGHPFLLRQFEASQSGHLLNIHLHRLILLKKECQMPNQIQNVTQPFRVDPNQG
jgi:hypothetical protein